jgi:hypothetical protein
LNRRRRARKVVSDGEPPVSESTEFWNESRVKDAPLFFFPKTFATAAAVETEIDFELFALFLDVFVLFILAPP